MSGYSKWQALIINIKHLSLVLQGLNREVASCCLPLDFRGLYALAGLEQDERIKATAERFMIKDIEKKVANHNAYTQQSSDSKINRQMY